MNKTTSGHLLQLLELGSIQLLAQVPTRDRSDAAQREEAAAIITIEVNVYGPRVLTIQVGNVLTAAGIHLQQPLFGLEGVAYYNPHVLHIAEVMGEVVLETPLISISNSSRDPEAYQAAALESRVDASTEVATILDSLSHHTVLHRHEVDGRIRTKLLE